MYENPLLCDSTRFENRLNTNTHQDSKSKIQGLSLSSFLPPPTTGIPTPTAAVCCCPSILVPPSFFFLKNRKPRRPNYKGVLLFLSWISILGGFGFRIFNLVSISCEIWISFFLISFSISCQFGFNFDLNLSISTKLEID